MALYKRGEQWWFEFRYRGERVRRSTGLTNRSEARGVEAEVRSALAKGEWGILERKAAPSLASFIEERFEPWARAQFERTSPATWARWYRPSLRVLSLSSMAQVKLDKITSEDVASFAAGRQAEGLQPSSVNRTLQVLRRVLRLAVEWGALPSAPRIKLLRGERHRERVLTMEEEARYLAAAPAFLADVASVLVDSGMRPEECFRLRWESIAWVNGRYGTLLVTHGKTKAARRTLPMTPRVRHTLEARWVNAGRPEEGWVWPAPTASGHIEPSTLRKQHRRALRLSGVRAFVLYSLRHTFLTRLGESGCDTWTLARIAGHSNVVMSGRYVHPGEDAVLKAMARLESKPTAALPS